MQSRPFVELGLPTVSTKLAFTWLIYDHSLVVRDQSWLKYHPTRLNLLMQEVRRKLIARDASTWMIKAPNVFGQTGMSNHSSDGKPRFWERFSGSFYSYDECSTSLDLAVG